MTRGETLLDRLAPGIYRVYWISGGSSLAAVGMNADGTNWLAPTNWLRTCSTSWDRVDHAQRLDRPSVPGPRPYLEIGSVYGVAFFDAGELVAELWLDGDREDPDDWYAREVERMSERAPA